MLNRLSINNYALIRNLEIAFSKSFTVITGETGAGKSIILGALGLILGNRADNLNYPDPDKKCSIEGIFDISECDLENFFEENNLDYDQSCIIRREITPQGKSRAFINDTPVNLNQLKELTSKLIDVHSQHQTLLLRENSFQLSVVDAIAANKSLLKQYKVAYKKWQKLSAELAIAQSENQKAKTELDYLNFLVDELSKAQLKQGEQELLEEELEVQNHSEDIKTKLFRSTELLLNNDENIIRSLKEVNNLVNSASRHYSEIKNLDERISSCIIELRDIAAIIEKSAESISFKPERMQEINDRLDIIYKLLQKHHLSNVDELITFQSDIENKIKSIDSLEEKVQKLIVEVQKVFDELIALAKNLSDRRKAVFGEIETAIIETIAQIGIKDATFKLDWRVKEELAKEGFDEVKFLFSANKGVEPDDVSRIASGGELSRLMLAVKSLVSTQNLLPTIVFDEIDSGISGDIGGKVGKILRGISNNMQVIAITHLPQIAALSDEHYKVSKITDTENTWSEIRKLNKEEQVDELALMISGDQNSQKAREAALELIENGTVESR